MLLWNKTFTEVFACFLSKYKQHTVHVFMSWPSLPFEMLSWKDLIKGLKKPLGHFKLILDSL